MCARALFRLSLLGYVRFTDSVLTLIHAPCIAEVCFFCQVCQLCGAVSPDKLSWSLDWDLDAAKRHMTPSCPIALVP